jgi:tetratricopeptide (TPR) repeat protein
MTRSVSLAVVSVMLTSGIALSAQQAAGPGLRALMPPAQGAQSTPAEQRIAAARNAIARDAKRVDAWNELALALARRARETADPAYYAEAWAATERSLELEPRNLEGRKLQVWILLGQHEFARAVEAADEINRAVPDDVLVYGFLADGYVELGRYADAEKAAQWMLDMRPGNVPGLTRAAHLRELFGDHAGAVEFMDSAYQRIPASELEDRAWILTQIAHVSLLTCRTESAERLLNDALTLFPNYHYALAQLAELRLQQRRLDDAVMLRQRHYQAAPHPENQYELGVVLHRAGRLAEANAAWHQFEAAARREMDRWDNANVELIYYYADHANRPAEAVRIAQKEAARRQNVRTLEALAWALHKDGKTSEALVQIERALAVGIKQPVSSYHAGVIAAAAGEADKARRHLDESVASCGTSVVADAAKDLLRSLALGR